MFDILLLKTRVVTTKATVDIKFLYNCECEWIDCPEPLSIINLWFPRSGRHNLLLFYSTARLNIGIYKSNWRDLLLSYKILNETIRRKTGIADDFGRASTLKWNWAGQLVRTRNGRWTKKIFEWNPREDSYRSRGPPSRRWSDDIKRMRGNWIQNTQNRDKRSEILGVYVQQWTQMAIGWWWWSPIQRISSFFNAIIQIQFTCFILHLD